MNTKSINISSPKTKVILFAVALAIVAIVPAFIHVQWITGPMVNAVLLISVVLIGPMEAVLLGLMPSTVALSAGLLPLPLAPMVPFIMMGNAILVAVFHYIYKKNFFAGIGFAALLKFAFLHYTVVWLMSGMLDGQLVAKLAVMMSWPQFFTAGVGGVIAYGLLKGLKEV
jgi:hypothetical protein